MASTKEAKTKARPKINESLPDGVKKRMANLKQYKEPEKQEPMPDEPIPVQQAVAELVPDTEVVDAQLVLAPEGPVHSIPITMKSVLAPEEYKVFVTEVKGWAESHPDWTLKEDMDDIHGIAMEKVLQYRLLLKRKRHPRADIEKDFNSSVYRMQAFRNNLAARRTDRLSGKGKIQNQTNIAIIASDLDATRIEEMKKRSITLAAEEEEQFPTEEA
jgi:hypothetical protein